VRDYFALLNEPRRPWLEPETLKQKFLALSAEVHPDRVHQASEAAKLEANGRYTELNAAYNCLREPRERLRHLLELELGQKPSDLTNVPNDLMELFFSVGKLLREVDAFVAEKGRATSPLLQVQLFERGQDWIERLSTIRKLVDSRREPLVGELKDFGDSWGGSSVRPIERLLEIWRLLSFYDRWLAQIQERVVQISF
jgi:DnaJ-domain-containing protein 1